MNRHRLVPVFLLACLCACSGGGTSAPATSPTSGPPVASASPAASVSSAPSSSAAPSAPSALPTATATSNGASTPAPSAAIPTATPLNLAAASVSVGPGYSDVSPHQIVRSSADRAYIAVPTCPSPHACNGNALIMYAANGTGTPGGFTALDTAGEPRAGSSGDSIGTSAIAIDGNDTIWVAWTQRASNGTMQIATFNAQTGAWSAAQDVQGTNNTGFTQGNEGVTIALDANGVPHVAYAAVESDGKLHIMYTNRVGGSWSKPIQIDDETIATGMNAMHPTLAFAPDGSLLFAWLDGGGEYTAGTIRTRVRSAGGTFTPSTLISGPALSSIDDGPSLLITADGTRHLTFDDPNVYAKYWYSADGRTWNGNRALPSQQTHDPSLGPDGASGVYIYGHGVPEPTIDAVGQNLYRFHLAAGSTTWSPFALWVSGTYDCSVSTRWSQFFMSFPTELDSVYWNSGSYPNMLLLGEG